MSVFVLNDNGERLMPTHILNEISEKTEADYVLLCLKDAPVSFGERALLRMLHRAGQPSLRS